MIVLVSLDVAEDGQVRGILQVERRRDPTRQLFGTAPLIDVVGYETLLVASLAALVVAIGITLLDRDLATVPGRRVHAEESAAASPAGG